MTRLLALLLAAAVLVGIYTALFAGPDTPAVTVTPPRTIGATPTPALR